MDLSKINIKNQRLLQIIEFSNEEIFTIFLVYARNEVLDIRDTSKVLYEIFLCDLILISDYDLERFQRLSFYIYPVRQIAEFYHKLLEKDTIEELNKINIEITVFYPKIGFSDFILLIECFLETQEEFDSFQRRITADIHMYKQEPEIEKVAGIIQALSYAYFEYRRGKYLTVDYENKFINEIYMAYNRPLSLKVYLQFLQDFEILGNPNENYRFIKLKEAKNIYSQICLNAMSLTQFKKCIHILSNEYFNAEFDRLYDLKYSVLNSREKIKLFYELIKTLAYKIQRTSNSPVELANKLLKLK